MTRLTRPTRPTRDLLVVAADANIEHALKGVLQRHEALQLRPFTFDVSVHPERDPGCLLRGATFCRAQAARYGYALIVFDRDGCGQEQKGRDALEVQVEAELAADWTPERSAVVVIEPELESWVWSDSPHVETALGWKAGTLLSRLRHDGHISDAQPKPAQPKERMEWALREARKPRSSSVYRTIAADVSLSRCTDASFGKLKATLRRWFAP
jgi:hypothetical protein